MLGCFTNRTCFCSQKRGPDQGKAEKAGPRLNQYMERVLSGAVYGFHLENKQGEVIDSCWGYYGDYDAKGGLLMKSRLH